MGAGTDERRTWSGLRQYCWTVAAAPSRPYRLTPDAP